MWGRGRERWGGGDKISGCDRDCRRQQGIQSKPINNILVRQRLPPPQQQSPRSTHNPLGPADWAPLITGLSDGRGAAQYASHTALTHLLPPFVGHSSFSMCVSLFRGFMQRGWEGVQTQGWCVCVCGRCSSHHLPFQCTHPPPKHCSISLPIPDHHEALRCGSTKTVGWFKH